MNLFDVTRGLPPHIGPRNKAKANDGPRQANKAEIEAYLRWIAAKRGIEVPRDATFQPDGIWSEEEGHVLPMPGYGDQPRVTLETLDESGAVISSQTLPVEPKKGGVIWDKAAVRRAYGPVEKPAKAKASRKAAAEAVPPIVEMAPAPRAISAEERLANSLVIGEAVGRAMIKAAERSGAGLPTEPVERVEEVSPARVAPEPVEALSGQHAANEPATDACRLPVPATVKDGLTVDPVAELAARLAALEARVAALPAEPIEVPTADEARPPRSAAHERAIRRAWAERKEARRQRQGAHSARQFYEAEEARSEELFSQVCSVIAERDALKTQLENARGSASRWRNEAEASERRERLVMAKRRRAVMLARDLGKRLSAEHRLVDRYQAKRREADEAAREWSRKEEGQRRRADMAEAALAKLRADLADPSQPERASDIARLVRERDEARVALAAVSARNAALQGSVNDLAERFEGMVSRVTRAEAALRAVGAGTPLPLPAPRMAPVAVPVPLSA